MLIEFNATNFRSIREKASLSMSASSSREHLETNSFSTGLKGLPRLLRSSAIYGPNASGKSTLVAAFHFMQQFVLSSHAQQEGQLIQFVPFRLHPETTGKPSEFEVHFVEGGVRYQYGFGVTSSQVVSEWLVAFPHGRPQRWFHRSVKENGISMEWEFSTLFHGGGRRRLWQESTRRNALFLSTAVQLNCEQLRPVFDWFARRLAVVSDQTLIHHAFSLDLCGNEEGRGEMMRFMKAADINISGIEIRKALFAPDLIPTGLPELIREQLIRDMKDKELANVRFRHDIAGGGAVDFDMSEESHGTQRLFWLAGPWLDILKKGRVLVVDELDASLHPLLMRFLVGRFHDAVANTGNAQLVLTTHDTSLLDDRAMRRDQFWFVEKNEDGSTRLFPLTDFHPRKEEAREAGYLKGRYGALPFIRKGRLSA